MVNQRHPRIYFLILTFTEILSLILFSPIKDKEFCLLSSQFRLEHFPSYLTRILQTHMSLLRIIFLYKVDAYQVYDSFGGANLLENTTNIFTFTVLLPTIRNI